MKSKSRNIVFSLVAVLFMTATGFAASEEKLDHDNSILSVFLQPSISFISFEERKYFQEAIDTIYYGFKENAVNSAESLNVAKQDFQKVNFCFPITAGIQWQFTEDHFLSAGIGFIYDNESVVLTDRKSNTHSYEYTLQGTRSARADFSAWPCVGTGCCRAPKFTPPGVNSMPKHRSWVLVLA